MENTLYYVKMSNEIYGPYSNEEMGRISIGVGVCLCLRISGKKNQKKHPSKPVGQRWVRRETR